MHVTCTFFHVQNACLKKMHVQNSCWVKMHFRNSCWVKMHVRNSCWVKMHVPSKKTSLLQSNLTPPKTSKHLDKINVFSMEVAKKHGKRKKDLQRTSGCLTTIFTMNSTLSYGFHEMPPVCTLSCMLIGMPNIFMWKSGNHMK